MDFSLDFLKKQFGKLEDNLFGRLNQKIEPVQKLMSYYKCALLAVETKFRVLNEEFSFLHERNPIDSIRKKLCKNQFPLTIDSMENNIHDIAGIRIICPFIDDIYVGQLPSGAG
jgi:putative GTP pyrophosphokinase